MGDIVLASFFQNLENKSVITIAIGVMNGDTGHNSITFEVGGVEPPQKVLS